MEYGTGAVMAVPGYDQCDWEFTTKYHLPIKAVTVDNEGQIPNLKMGPLTEKNALTNSGEFSGMDNQIAANAIADKLVALGLTQRKVNYRLCDWGVSRQCYWGAPIPMVTMEDGSIMPVPEEQLPVI